MRYFSANFHVQRAYQPKMTHHAPKDFCSLVVGQLSPKLAQVELLGTSYTTGIRLRHKKVGHIATLTRRPERLLNRLIPPSTPVACHMWHGFRPIFAACPMLGTIHIRKRYK